MKAIRIHQYGDATTLRYEDAPMPVLQPDEVLIRVAATSFNPIDIKIRAGFMKDMIVKSFPLILGWDCRCALRGLFFRGRSCNLSSDPEHNNQGEF